MNEILPSHHPNPKSINSRIEPKLSQVTEKQIENALKDLDEL